MLHNEARELLVQGYEATHDAKGIAKAYSVSKWTVYRLAEQKRKTGSSFPSRWRGWRSPAFTSIIPPSGPWTSAHSPSRRTTPRTRS